MVPGEPKSGSFRKEAAPIGAFKRTFVSKAVMFCMRAQSPHATKEHSLNHKPTCFCSQAQLSGAAGITSMMEPSLFNRAFDRRDSVLPWFAIIITEYQSYYR